MEKKEDASSPVGVLEDYFKSEESESCSSKDPASDAEAAQNVSKAASRWRGFFQLIRSRSKKSLATLHPLGVLKLSMRRSNSMRENIISNLFANSDSSSFKSPRINFTLSELQAATNNFSQGLCSVMLPFLLLLPCFPSKHGLIFRNVEVFVR